MAAILLRRLAGNFLISSGLRSITDNVPAMVWSFGGRHEIHEYFVFTGYHMRVYRGIRKTVLGFRSSSQESEALLS